MENNPIVLTNQLTLEDFTQLCSSVGWAGSINFAAAEKSLKNTLFSVIIKENDTPIGMGRIIGDGAIYFYIQDVVVHPDYQGQGLGRKILSTLVEYLEQNAPHQSFVGLFASEGNETFYERFNFKDYSPNMTGMFKVINK